MTKKAHNKDPLTEQDRYHRLSIQVGLNGLSFCILDTIANTLSLSYSRLFDQEVSPFELHREVRESFRRQGVLEYRFAKVIAIHRNTLFSLVPGALFDREHLPSYLKYNAKILATDQMAYDPVEGLDAVNVYVPFTNVNNYLYDLYGEFEFKHSGTVLLESLLKLPKSRQGHIGYLHLAESQMDLAIFSGKKLLFYNSFPISGPEDVLYYLLFTLEQLHMETGTLRLRLLGDVTEEDPVYALCAEYFEHLSRFVPEDAALPVSAPEQDIDFTLISAL